MVQKSKTRVLVLGGGLGGVSAALTLTSTLALRERFDVTLVNHGWRLGGKGASGRNALHGQRIEEHGLHIFLGFYETAFQMVRGAYTEWQKPSDYAFQTWEQAFQPLYQVTLMQEVPHRKGPCWHPWTLDLPPHPGTPGDGQPLLRNILLPELLKLLEELIGSRADLPDAIRGLLNNGKLAAIRQHLEGLNGAEPDADFIRKYLMDIQNKFQEIVAPILEKKLSSFPDLPGEIIENIIEDIIWDLLSAIDFGLALLIGYVCDVLPYGVTNFDRINDKDFRDWLMDHGLLKPFAWSGLVRLVYDLCFSYQNGDTSGGPKNARFAAGTAVEILTLMGFAYKGAPLWKMNAGMGDTVFSPAWFVLKQRGVNIRLFTRLEHLELSEDEKWVERITLTRQVKLRDGHYDPFVKVPYGDAGQWLYCWPSEPHWDQIEDGENLKKSGINLESVFCHASVGEETLEVGKDFDLCVLAMPPAALAKPAEALAKADPRFCKMIETLPSVPTQATQLWMRPTTPQMGWLHGPTAMTGYAEPLDSWGEMSHLLEAENWKIAPPKSIQYLCGAVPWPTEEHPPYSCGLPTKLATEVEATTRAWLNANASVIWPLTVARIPGHTNGKFLMELVRSTYYRYNLDPSELYVQCFPGTLEARLQPRDSGFINAFLAGDWTRTWFSAGSADIAVLSGKEAAEAIARHPIDTAP